MTTWLPLCDSKITLCTSERPLERRFLCSWDSPSNFPPTCYSTKERALQHPSADSFQAGIHLWRTFHGYDFHPAPCPLTYTIVGPRFSFLFIKANWKCLKIMYLEYWRNFSWQNTVMVYYSHGNDSSKMALQRVLPFAPDSLAVHCLWGQVCAVTCLTHAV